MPHVSRCHARFAAGLLIAELVAGLSLRVLFPKPGARIVASETDGFLMEIFVDGMDRTRRDCGEWTMSIVEGDTELFASREALCSCFEPDEHDDMLMSSCIIKSVFRRPSSATPSMEISLLDASGRELASTTSTHQVLVRNDTGLRARIAELQQDLALARAGGHGSSGGHWAIAIDELQWFASLFRFERRVFSQDGEDGVIAEVFKRFGTTNKIAVEFGTEDAQEVNSRRLWEQEGWRAILLDGSHENASLHANAALFRHFITRENIVDILQLRGVPESPDLMSIDIDYNDFWVLDRLLCSFSPRVIVAEVNRNWGPHDAFTVPYDAKVWWTGSLDRGFPHGTMYYGMSNAALHVLARAHGYTVAYVFHNSVNALLLRDDLLPEEVRELLVLDLVFPQKYPGLHATYSGARPFYQVAWAGDKGQKTDDGEDQHGAGQWQMVQSCGVQHGAFGKATEAMWVRPMCVAVHDTGASGWVNDRDWPIRGFTVFPPSGVDCEPQAWRARAHDVTMCTWSCDGNKKSNVATSSPPTPSPAPVAQTSAMEKWREKHRRVDRGQDDIVQGARETESGYAASVSARIRQWRRSRMSE